MEYHLLYENSDILTNDDIISVNPNLKSAWDTPSDNSSMDNDEYYEWNSMKIDEDSKLQPENTSTIDKHGKLGKKRKLTGGRESRHSSIDDVQDPLATPKSKQVKKGAGATVMPNGVSRMPPHWPVDDISDIDGSITTLDPNQYNMSDAILSISGLTVFKQEVPSPTSQEVAALKLAQRSSQSPTSTQESPRNVLEDANADQHMINNTINQLLNQTGYGNLQTAFEANLVSPHSSQDSFSVTSTNFNFSEDCRFQYVLAAATSIATKINEDTLTYLNQGQSYEIKLKKLGDLSMYRGKILKSVVRICFHERRLQYMEKEQMALWQRARPGDRILEVDIPLSYGAFEVIQPNNALNVVHFNWDPTKEVGVYIKVNCISTEFTPKKHGGEKGVPFRIQVETYTASENPETAKRLHAAACQIKVFKLKGADRKHKQDRDKIMKRSLTEQEKFQPSYECTVLNDIPNEAVLSSPAIAPILSNDGGLSNKNLSSPISPKINTDPLCILDQSPSIIAQQKIDHTSENSEENEFRQLTLEGTPKQTELWLRGNRFEKYAQTFACFSGADMLRLSRNDIMQMCGQPDGIRLFNALHAKIIAPRLKIFVSRENSTVFNAIFLTAHCNHELLKKLAAMVGVSHDQVRDIFMEGPQSIHVQLCNDVIRHIKDDSMFHLEIIRDNDAYIFLLKSIMK